MAAVPAESCEKAVQVGANFEPEPQKIVGFLSLMSASLRSKVDKCILRCKFLHHGWL